MRHYPWPDHHPPPFAVVPLVMGGMRKWLNEGEKIAAGEGPVDERTGKKRDTQGVNPRVVVGHCKAGKGRTGSMACSYLISECGWTVEEALARFTERRMRPGFGQGVSIPSQLRWVGYVDRWTKGGKIYVEKQVEILELHCWGLRDGVKVAIEGYIEEGKVIKTFHIFNKKERVVIEGNAPGSSGFTDYITDMAGYNNDIVTPQDASNGSADLDGSTKSRIEHSRKRMTMPLNAKAAQIPDESSSEQTGAEEGGLAVVFKPIRPVILPTSDVNIDFERRNKAKYGFSMVTAVAHVWFNAFFEGNGPENNGVGEDTGVFEIDWDKMDGIKGSLRKGTRALDRLAIVWRIVPPAPGSEGDEHAGGKVIHEPGDQSPVPQMAAADWRGENHEAPGLGRDLGLRTETPHSADVSKASSMKSEKTTEADTDDDSVKGVKVSGPSGEEDLQVDMKDLPQPKGDAPEPTLAAVNGGLDTASSTTPLISMKPPT